MAVHGNRSAALPGYPFTRTRIRIYLKLAFDVLVVYPAMVLAFLLLWGGGFTFEGMARSYVNEMATYAGRPATDRELTAIVCVDPLPVSPVGPTAPGSAGPAPLQAPTPCQHWQPQLVNKEVIVQKLAIGSRVAYWFIVLTALAIRLALSSATSFASGRSISVASDREACSQPRESIAAKRSM